MAKSTKMSAKKKVAIAAGLPAIVGAILCYFYCPCFRKGGAAEGGVGADGL